MFDTYERYLRKRSEEEQSWYKSITFGSIIEGVDSNGYAYIVCKSRVLNFNIQIDPWEEE